MKKYIWVYLLGALNLLNFSAQAEALLRSYSPGRFQLDVTGNYFKSSANFLSNSTKQNLFSSSYFQNIDIQTEARYVLIENLGISAGFNVANAESSDVLATRKNSAINKIFFGTDYLLYQSSIWNLMAEFGYSHSLDTVDIAGDSVINNDGASEIKAIVTGSLNWGWMVPFFQGGINYRTGGLSTLALYSLGTEFRFEGFTLGGMINGYATVKDDEETNKLTRDAVLTRVNAGSKRFYSVNPSLTDSEVYLRYFFDHDFSVKAFGGYTIIGTNSAEGFHFGGALTWAFGGGSSASYPAFQTHSRAQKARKSAPKRLTIDPNEKGFSEDINDGVNQDYFKPVNPGKEDYIEQIEGSQKSLENVTKPDPEEIQVTTKPKVITPSEKEYKIKLKKKKK